MDLRRDELAAGQSRENMDQNTFKQQLLRLLDDPDVGKKVVSIIEDYIKRGGLRR